MNEELLQPIPNFDFLTAPVMIALRVLVTFASTILLLIFLLYLALASHSQHNSRTHQSGDKTGSLRDFFYFRNPGSLFSPSATISLTDDNSTFFAARPAAFGPLVPSKGLSGQIWIGSGFGGNILGHRSLHAALEGELGCNDVPGWIDRHTSDRRWMESPSRPSSTHSSHPFRGNHSALFGKIALLSRGGCNFSDKVKWAQRRGAAAVIIGDNIKGGPLVRMYAHGDVSNVKIASLFTSHTAAQLLSSLVPSTTEDVSAMSTDNSPKDEVPQRHRIPENVDLDDGEISPPNALDLRTKHDEPSGTENRSRPVLVHHETEAGFFRDGLWVTLTLSGMSTSPFFNTLFVLVVSPLITLAIVYTMLLIRSRIRRRRWRAPKSVVDRLPIRVYRALSGQSSPSRNPQQPETQSDERSALIAASHPTISSPLPCPRASHGAVEDIPTSSQYGSMGSAQTVQEKADNSVPSRRPKPSIKQIECAVCLEEYVDGISRIMSLPCGHEFHADCM